MISTARREAGSHRSSDDTLGSPRKDSSANEWARARMGLLRLMYVSREGDRREGVLLRQGKGWFQISGMGHEALAAIALALRPSDYLFPYYRDRALALAKGMTNRELALAFFGK